MEASRKLPGKDVRLETADSTYYYFMADIFKGTRSFSASGLILAFRICRRTSAPVSDTWPMS